MQTSGIYKIDGLLSGDPGLAAANTNTISYSFAVPSVGWASNVSACSAQQQAAVAALLAYIGGVTGINFVAAAGNPTTNVIRFGQGDVASAQAAEENRGGGAFDIVVDTISYTGRADWSQGTWAWGLLLHEVGHALGLEHPTLPAGENSSAYTVMSYNWSWGAPSTYRPYDLYALSWIYGGDGIGGTWGIGSTNGPVAPPELYPPITHTISGGAAVSEASGQFSFTVTRAGNLSVATTVAWAITGAVDAADFGGTLPSGVVSFAAGETTKTVSFSASNDELPEANEAFTVALGARTGNGAILGDTTSANYTLLDDDTPPTISISAAAQAQEGQPVVFTLTRSGNLGKASDITWALAAGTASADDFAGGTLPAGGTLSFAPGVASIELPIATAADGRVELDECFFVNLYASRFATIGSGQGIGTIANDDLDSTFTIAAKTAKVMEGNSGSQAVEFVVTRTGNTAAPASVGWTRGGSVYTDDLAAGAAASGTLAFAAGETSKTIRFTVLGDTRVENDETLTVTLGNVTGLGAGLGAATSASTTIVTDDPKGAVSVGTARASVAEGNVGSQLTHSFTLTRTGDLTDAASIPWTVGGSVDANDFVYGTLLTGTASFAAGAASTTLAFITSGDALYEADETLTLTVGDGDIVTASPTQGSATVTLLNDDEPNEFRLGLALGASARVNEGSTLGAKSSVKLEITRVGDLTTAASVDYRVAGSGSHAADATDFGAGGFAGGSVTFQPGEKTKTLFVNWSQDKTPESDETFTVTLGNGVGAGVSSTRGAVEVTIANDDALPTLAIAASAAQVTEGASGTTTVSFDITRSGDASAAGSVGWTLAGSGSDPADAADFVAGQAMSGSVSFAAGQTRQTLTVQVKGDTTVEHTEAFTMTLKSPVAGALSATAGSATVSIVNDDAGHRTITGTAANNERLTLHGVRADYTVTYDASDDHVKVIDGVAGRDGEIDLTAVEVLQFTDGRLKAVPDATQKAMVELGQVVLGSSGLYGGLWGGCTDIAAQQGINGLGAYAAQAVYATMDAHTMAVAVLHNLAASAATLGGTNPAASYDATVAMLAGMFTGDANVRGQALVAVATVLGTLEADPVYGRVAAAFNDRVGAEWIAEFAGDAVTLTGLPGVLVEVTVVV